MVFLDEIRSMGGLLYNGKWIVTHQLPALPNLVTNFAWTKSLP